MEWECPQGLKNQYKFSIRKYEAKLENPEGSRWGVVANRKNLQSAEWPPYKKLKSRLFNSFCSLNCIFSG